MKKTFNIAIGAVMSLAAYAAPTLAQDVGVSVSIGQPGFYGRIDIGDAPRPRIIYAEPRIVEHVRVVEAPVYLRVRPGHARNWKRHCREYDACGQRVYFVNDNWYNTVYVDHYRARGGQGGRGNHDNHDSQGRDDRDEGHGNGNGKGRGHGNGHGNGRGNGKGHD